MKTPTRAAVREAMEEMPLFAAEFYTEAMREIQHKQAWDWGHKHADTIRALLSSALQGEETQPFDKAALARIQIDKVCDMALDPEACQAYQITALQTIQNINAQSGSMSLLPEQPLPGAQGEEEYDRTYGTDDLLYEQPRPGWKWVPDITPKIKSVFLGSDLEGKITEKQAVDMVNTVLATYWDILMGRIEIVEDIDEAAQGE